MPASVGIRTAQDKTTDGPGGIGRGWGHQNAPQGKFGLSPLCRILPLAMSGLRDGGHCIPRPLGSGVGAATGANSTRPVQRSIVPMRSPSGVCTSTIWKRNITAAITAKTITAIQGRAFTPAIVGVRQSPARPEIEAHGVQQSPAIGGPESVQVLARSRAKLPQQDANRSLTGAAQTTDTKRQKICDGLDAGAPSNHRKIPQDNL
jgi:hypothetical protein